VKCNISTQLRLWLPCALWVNSNKDWITKILIVCILIALLECRVPTGAWALALAVSETTQHKPDQTDQTDTRVKELLSQDISPSLLGVLWSEHTGALPLKGLVAVVIDFSASHLDVIVQCLEH
jgi:hypothetical protein